MLGVFRRNAFLVFAAAVGAACGDATDDSIDAGAPDSSDSSDAEVRPDGGSLDAVTDAEPVAWDPDPEPPPCRADGDAPVLDEALADTGLARDSFGFDTDDLRYSDYYRAGILSDEFLLSWFFDVRATPHRAGCFEGEVISAIDAHLDGAHPVASMIRTAARLLDRAVVDSSPYDPRTLTGTTAQAIESICMLFGSPCAAATGELPDDLAQALAPLFFAIRDGIDARRVRDASAAPRDPEWWTEHGGNGVIISTISEFYDPKNTADHAYLRGDDRAALYDAAAKIAFAIEHTDWTPFVGRFDVAWDQATPAGWIRVRDGNDDRYEKDEEPILLLVDLGGDDEHRDDVASNRNASNAVSIVVDLAGRDRYAYDTVRTRWDRDGLVAADDGGRYRGDANFGNITLSRHARQGAARNGIAMLFDLGEDDDWYGSLVASQGYAHQGVGVLFDAGGSDQYLAEATVQGAAQFGIALAVDKGAGNDVRRAFTNAQGFGYVAGAGFLVDGGGDDVYVCDHGDPDAGGIALYASAQLPGRGNNSMCQGMGFGARGPSSNRLEYMSGGIGVLRDRDGNDRYECSVFGQGSGYWQGTGLLSDGGGADVYDGRYYVLGAAAHYAVGILADAGPGMDIFNGTRPPSAVTTGSGHDFSVGVFIDDEGDSVHHVTTLSAGSSNCNGAGLFVDNGGNDSYIAVTDYSSGMGNVSDECIGTRPRAVSIGVMIDAGGTDRYEYPINTSSIAIPSDGGTWGHARHALASEHGAGLDRVGESGVHPESAGMAK